MKINPPSTYVRPWASPPNVGHLSEYCTRETLIDLAEIMEQLRCRSAPPSRAPRRRAVRRHTQVARFHEPESIILCEGAN